MYRKTLILCFFLLTSALAHAQKIWTLRECVDYALAHNLSVKQQEVQTDLASIEQSRSRLALLPGINASASDNYNYGRSVDPFSYTFTTEQVRSDNLSLTANVTLFDGFQLQNTLRQSQLNYLAGKSDLEKIRNDISLNVVSYYLQILYNQEKLGAAKNRVDESGKQRDRARFMFDAGAMTQGQLLDAESQLAAEELAAVNAENQLNTSRLNLIQLLQIENEEGFQVEAPKAEAGDITILMQAPTAIYKEAEKSFPEVKGADLRVESARKGLSIARGTLSPRLTAYGTISTGYSNQTLRLKSIGAFNGYEPNGDLTSAGDTVLSPSFSSSVFEETPFNDQLDQNLNKSFGFNLSIPIFNGFSSQLGIRRAKLNLRSAEYNAKETRLTLLKNIQQAHADAIAAQKSFVASQKTKDAMAETNSYMEKRFNAGLSSSIEYLNARNNLTKSESDLLQARYDFIFRVKILDFYAGKALAL